MTKQQQNKERVKWRHAKNTMQTGRHVDSMTGVQTDHVPHSNNKNKKIKKNRCSQISKQPQPAVTVTKSREQLEIVKIDRHLVLRRSC